MRITIALGLALIAAFIAPTFSAAQSTPTFIGEWVATAHPPGVDTGTSERVSVVKTNDGYTVTAKLMGDAVGMPEAGPGEEIVLEGDHFAYKRTLAMGGNKLVIAYAGVVSGDTFSGTVTIGGMGTMPYTGVRMKHD
jgi:hypothetical protein